MKNPAIHSSGPITSTCPESLSPKIRKAFSRGPQALFVMLLSVSLLLQSQSLNAQAPQQFSFQGVARDASGKVVTNGEIGYSFSIHQTSANGPVVYQNEGYTTTNSAGVFNLTIGKAANPLPSTIQWGADKYFLQVGIDPDGAAGGGFIFTDLGTTQLISVPFALYSNEAGKWRNDAPIVQKGSLGLNVPLPSVGSGASLIWHPSKFAFRAGYADGSEWEDNEIGAASFAVGMGTRATGAYSVAAGYQSKALALNAIALGSETIANTPGAVAIGEQASATADNTISIGKNTTASTNSAVAIGLFATASGLRATSIGTSTTASGESSTALGLGTVAKSFGGTSLGAYNNSNDAGIFQEPTDRIFQIGNGLAPANRSNAMTVLRNGNVGIGNNVLSPEFILDIGARMRLRHNGNTAGLWLNNSNNAPFAFIGAASDHSAGFYVDNKWVMTVSDHVKVEGIVSCTEVWESSDKLLKRNIVNITGSLNKLRLLSGYNYHWASRKSDDKMQTGLIAQEIEKHFPELVSTKEDGFKAVRYTGLIPHLIEAVKELDKKTEEITALKKELASMQELNKKLSALEANVKMLLAGQAETTSQTGK